MLFAQTVTDVCGSSPDLLCRWIFDLTGSDVAADVSAVVIHLARALLILLGAWIINRILHRTIDRTVAGWLRAGESDEADEPDGRFASLRALSLNRARRRALRAERARQRTQTLGAVLRSSASLVIYSMAGAMVLGEFGVNLGPLIASAGIAGVALGFGAQSLVKDFLSGIFMLVEDQFGVGDIIDVGDAAGVVEEVKLRTTQIRDVNGTLWHVPNGEIRRVANKSQEWARAVLDIEVAYDTDLEHASSVIKQVADRMWEEQIPEATILEEPEVWGVEALGASGIALRLVVKVDPAEQWTTARILRRRIKDAFDAERIEIPFPQRTVWLKSDQPAD